MLGRMGWWRHALVGSATAGCAALGLTGQIGTGNHDERFDAKQVVVQPAGPDGLRVREVVDQDFGNEQRHGYERIVPHDFGVPIDIVASSPDAEATVGTATDFSLGEIGTRIRLGDPDTTYRGQHRYVLEYTYPAAQVATGQLALDIIGDREQFETGRFEIVVTGLRLTDTKCNVGPEGTVGGCELRADGPNYVAVIEPLRPGNGVTIGGTIVGQVDPTPPAMPVIPERRSDQRGLVGGLMLPLGVASGAGVYWWSRRRGRNEVFAGGAADAAFGVLPPPNSGAAAPQRSGAPAPMTSLVPDDHMDELATIEFVPPAGVAPWEAAVVLDERLDDSTVSAWISGLVAEDVLTITREGKSAELARGPKRDPADASTDAILDVMFGGRTLVPLGKYDPLFSKAWKQIRSHQSSVIAESGWWKRMPPSSGTGTPLAGLIVIVIALFAFGAGSILTAALGIFRLLPLALLFGLAVPAVFAYGAYRVLRPARSATGSAMALRSESFRRFLEASEGKHVDWAWKQGLLREYSAWAVALGAAGAWQRAMQTSHAPPAEVSMMGPLIVHDMGGAMSSTRTAPTQSGSSGGGGGGGFSGGSSGGGGGGGSSGSW
jgi:uncharacterized membrane protein YgcG